MNETDNEDTAYLIALADQVQELIQRVEPRVVGFVILSHDGSSTASVEYRTRMPKEDFGKMLALAAQRL